MSYILDALKKAQADKSSEGRAALALELKDRSRQRRWRYLVFAALLLNAGVLVALFGPWPAGDEQKARAVPATTAKGPAATTMEVGPAPPPAGVPEPAAGPRPAEVTQPAATPAPGTSQAERTASTRVPAAPATPAASGAPPPTASRTQVPPRAEPAAERISFAALPASARARFPTLDFSTHLYASDAQLRAVVMNGQRLQEGERYGELELEEITETGVVLRFEGYLVSVPVLDDWQ